LWERRLGKKRCHGADHDRRPVDEFQLRSGDGQADLRFDRRELAPIYPKLSGIEFAQGWDGVIDWSLDASPSVGRTGRYKNVSYGIGHGGHGVNLTSVFGRIIAELEAGRAEPWRQYPFV
jgi:glycine/D-amino acid oxidase-like deaminating enzyme